MHLKKLFILILSFISLSFANLDSLKKAVNPERFEISHHVNLRNSPGYKYDWFVNIDTRYIYDDYIHPELRLFASTERDKGIRYKAVHVRTSSDFYFIDNYYDEENKTDVFSSGIHFKYFKIKHGVSFMRDHEEDYYGLYHEYKNDWLLIELQYFRELLKFNTEVNIKHNWTKHFFGSLVNNFYKVKDRKSIWSLGYKLGWEL